MSIVLFSTGKKHVCEHLQRAIEKVVPGDKIEIYRTIDSLSSRLRQPKGNLKVVVVLASDNRELDEILSLRDLLSDVRIILILPDKKKLTVSKGHKLFPRFLSYTDSNFDDVSAVLQKMINNQPI